MQAFKTPIIQNSQRLRAIALALLVFLGASMAVSYRLDVAPDLFTDEIVYSRIAVRVAGEGAMVWDNGDPFLVHPPLFFLAQGLNDLLFGDPSTPLYAPGDIFAIVLTARRLNALLAGATALLLYLLGTQFHSRTMGLFAAILFAFDPFGVRINRRAMMETMATLLALGGVAAFYATVLRAQRKRGTPLFNLRLVASGLLLGAGMLTKELTIIFPLSLILFAVWHDLARRSDQPGFRFYTLLQALIANLIAGLMYVIYPLWVFTTGEFSSFWAEKSLGVLRLFGLVQLTGWNRPGISLGALLLDRLSHYGTSYLLLATGGVATLWLLLVAYRRVPARLAASMGLVFYPFFAFVTVAGAGNDQFFYFLLVPALLIVGYAVFTLPAGLSSVAEVLGRLGFPTNRLRFLQASLWHRYAWILPVTLLILVLPFNLYRWIVGYATGSDNGYQRMSLYIQENVPPGEVINASGDPIKFRYYLPGRTIVAAGTVAEAQTAGIKYFALAPKDARLGYGNIKPELADWLLTNGEQLFAYNSDSYGELYLMQVDNRKPNPDLSAAEHGSSLGKQFLPAETAFIDGFVGMLLLWVAAWVVLPLAAGRIQSSGPSPRPTAWQTRLDSDSNPALPVSEKSEARKPFETVERTG